MISLDALCKPIERLVQLFETGTVTTIEGQKIPFRFDSICVHGDTADALEIVHLVVQVCKEKGIAIKSMSEIVR